MDYASGHNVEIPADLVVVDTEQTQLLMGSSDSIVFYNIRILPLWPTPFHLCSD
jgi:hypothetical protein